MEILKDLTKEHAVIAGIALVAGMAHLMPCCSMKK